MGEMNMRHLGTLMALLALAAARPVLAQSDEGYVERGPRFLLASAKQPVRVDTRRTPVLRQRISLDLQGVTLGEALRDVSSKSGVRLAFSDAVLPPGRRVEFRADNITVAAALTELLVDAEVDVLFSRDGGGVLVRRQNPRAVIRGTVTDSTGSPLEGASVTVAGSALRAETNSSGQYVLPEVAPGTVVIRAHLIGYHPAERTVTVADGADLTVDFILAPGVAQLEEIVAIGYGTRERGELSTAVSSVGSAEIANQPISSVDAALQGKASGVQVVQNAGNPGNAVSVRIRGSASVSASNDPLYVIDGMPMISGDISQLDAGGQGVAAISGLSLDDVDRVDVLKDAAATAIYGSRGSNGVVLITTKRGAVGGTSVTLNSYVGTQSASRRLELLNSREYLEFFNESASNDGYGANYYGEIGVADSVNTDWQDAVLRSAPVSSSELAVSGGDQRLQYRISGTWFDQEGIVRSSGYRRVGGRINLDFNPSGTLSLRTGLAISGDRNDRVENDGSDVGIITNAVGEAPLVPVQHPSGGFTGLDDGLEYPNPAALQTLNDIRARGTHILGNVEGRLRITPSFHFTSRFGLDLVNLREEQFESRQVSGTYASSANGVAKSGYSTGDRYLIENFVSLFPDFGDRHDLEVTAGGSVELNRGELNFIRGEGFSSDEFKQVRNATIITDFDGTEFENNLVSFFARADYTLARKYTLGGSLRTDASSRFGPNDRWGVFPAISASWLLSEEPWIRGGFFDFLKLRTSLGLTGNQAIDDYPFQGLVGSANYGDEPGIAPDNLPNPDLKWETTAQFNVGLDMAFARGRVSLSADWYQKKTRDLLLERPITATSGYTTVFDNVGNVINRGLELGLTTVNVDSRKADGFRWTTTLNLGFNHNKVTALFNNQPFSDGIRSLNRVAVGQPIGAFYTLHFLGVDPATGDAIYEDRNGDGSITSDDFTIVGSPHPDYTGGLTSSFTWKGFDLTGFLTFSQGNDVFNAMRIFSDAGGWFLDNQFRDVLDRWQKPGDETDTPRTSYDGTSGAAEISSRYMEDGSYWRLQDLTLGYRLPERWAGGLGFAHARFYGSIRNLFTITDYSGYSPDVNSNGQFESDVGLGTDFYSYPQARTFTFGVQASW
jgi:TonB-linked SusC/RagA family outer membrane protein